MTNRTKRWGWMAGIALAAASLGSVGCVQPKEESVRAVEKPSAQPSVLINLTHGKNDLHAVTMALSIATQAQEAGRPTTLFLSVYAPEIATKGVAEDMALQGEEPVKKMLADFIAKGGKVRVCAHCMQVADIKIEDLVSGAQSVNGKQLLDEAGNNVLSLSY